MDTQEFIKLARSLVTILGINDKYQRIRLEAILGFPQIIIEEVSQRHNFPVFGYNKLPNCNQKWLEIKNIFNYNNFNTSLISKLYYFSSNERTICEVFLIILEAAITNHALMKYIRYLPKEEPGNGSDE